MKKYIVILVSLFTFSCGMKTFTLQNGFSKAPVNPSQYIEKMPFDNTLIKIIDTDAVYEEYSDNYSLIKKYDNYISFLRFYSNGCFSIFYSDKNRIEKSMFDPKKSGYRGYYNRINNEIRFDKFGEINQMREYGKLSGIINVKGDTLYVYTKKNNESQIFIKRKVAKELLDFNADW